MKFKKISTLSLWLIPIAYIPTSCKVGNNQLTNVINIVKNNFESPNTNLGEVNSLDEAKEIFIKKLLDSSETRLEEVLFDLFNFLGADGFGIEYDNKKLQILPNSDNFIKLYNNKKCVIDTQYNYRFESNTDLKYFSFIFQGYLNIQMVDDLSGNDINLKKGDKIQFFYDIESWIKVEVVDVEQSEQNQDLIPKVQYSYTESNDIKRMFGFIKLMTSSENYYPDFAICNIDDVNFTSNKHHILKCSLK